MIDLVEVSNGQASPTCPNKEKDSKYSTNISKREFLKMNWRRKRKTVGYMLHSLFKS